MAAPNWYVDPQNPALVRWFDGQHWTVHTQPVSVPPVGGANQFTLPTATATAPAVRAPAPVEMSLWGRHGGYVTIALVLAPWTQVFLNRVLVYPWSLEKKAYTGFVISWLVGFVCSLLLMRYPAGRNRIIGLAGIIFSFLGLLLFRVVYLQFQDRYIMNMIR